MKTADLIPFILLELADCDKYGFELTKNIENKSDGKIVIKQPTLYTLLKKLEKSKFISSYWQDSEIGGKRHYYKLTENGKLQVSTLPSYDFLIKSALDEEVDELEMSLSRANVSLATETEEKPISIMDELLNNPAPKPLETILPTDEVFKNDNIDTSTELERNLSNVDMLKDEKIKADENFATNEDVATFTSKIKPNSIDVKLDSTMPEKNDILSAELIAPHSEMQISFVDYVDFKNSKENVYAKKVVAKKLLQTFATCASILLMIALCELITMFTGHSALYYIFFISSILTLIFYPVIYAVNMEKLRLKYQNVTYQIKTKQRIFIGLTIVLIVLVVGIIASLNLGKNTIASLLHINNFANIYAPIIMFIPYFLDVLFKHLMVSKIKK